MKDHANALRAHIKSLASKEYQELIQPSPDFVICFVPSEEALTEALHADIELLNYAAQLNVAVVNPSSLLPMMWSVAFIVRQQATNERADDIYKEASELVSRLGKIYEYVNKVGSSLNTSVRSYNQLIGSFETRLSVTANRIQSLAGHNDRKVPELSTVDQFSRPLLSERWESSDEEASTPVLDLTAEEVGEGE
jgi:DNA recombination protein RmuC